LPLASVDFIRNRSMHSPPLNENQNANLTNEGRLKMESLSINEVAISLRYHLDPTQHWEQDPDRIVE
jgi:hypothetical protein